MTSNIVIGPSRVSEILIFFFRIFGMWFYPDTTIAYKIYGFIFHFIFSFLYVLCFVVNIFFLSSVSEATISLCITLTVVALLVKTLNFYWYIYRMEMNLYKIHKFQLINNDEKEFVNKRINWFMKLVIFYYILVNTTATTTYINALFAKPIQLPFYAWYPLDWKHNNRDYWLVYCYQTLGMIVEANLNITIELFPCFTMFMISVKLELLGERLENLKFVSMKKNKDLIGNDYKMDENDRKLERTIVNCIKTHQHIMDLINDAQSCFSAAYFFQMCMSGVAICSLAYQLANTSPRKYLEYGFYLTFITSLITQVLLPCYFGNAIILKSEILPLRAYSSDWYQFSSIYKRNLIIFLIRLKQNSKFLMGKLFPMSLPTFSSIMNVAYRLFALLQNFHE